VIRREFPLKPVKVPDYIVVDVVEVEVEVGVDAAQLDLDEGVVEVVPHVGHDVRQRLQLVDF